ncbi:MAG: CsgG/HfaB family protein [Cyclobacteriaceae bacterium]
MNKLSRLLIAVVLVTVTSCSQYFHQPMKIKESRLGAESSQYKDLVSLPAPKEKIVAAVYKFRDQTGQYKSSEIGTSWSTAVTQGSTSILLRAMEESKWFIPIERESLSNLLNERKIIRSSRANYIPDENKDPLLPPLLFAGILLEGGIVSFDSNILTGGAGARYFGAGASTQYREDRVTIYLRAVSTGNGRILKTVYTSKTILSQKLDVNFFRFVKVQRLLEAETGFTYNEPGEMAIKDAIEKAVIGLVIEGLNDGLWILENQEEMKKNPVVLAYLKEKEMNDEIGVFDDLQQERRGFLGFSISGAATYFNGDYSGSPVKPSAEMSLELFANKPLSFSFSAGYSQVGIYSGYNSNAGNMDLSIRYRFFNKERFSPFIRVGGGALYEIDNSLGLESAGKSSLFYYGMAELGGEYLLTNKIGLSAGINWRMLATDDLDHINQGKFNDFIWQGKLGLSFYIGN